MTRPRLAALVLTALALLVLPVCGAPMVARANAPVQLARPVALAADPSGTIYLLDWANPHVEKITSNGALAATWAVAGALPTNPGWIAADGKDHVYVIRNVRHGSTYTGAITKYSSAGRALATWSSMAWLNACGLAAAANGTLYVLLPELGGNKNSATVYTISTRGTIVGAWHIPRYGHDFLLGQAIAVDTHNNLYVSAVAGSCSRGCQGAEADILLRRAPSGKKRVTAWTSGVLTGLGLAVESGKDIFRRAATT